ncbi:MAG: hypothetical protein NC215_07820, partial [Ruminococcus sp.]|nr:hypothetical protein [Ruminococcus sp.]
APTEAAAEKRPHVVDLNFIVCTIFKSRVNKHNLPIRLQIKIADKAPTVLNLYGYGEQANHSRTYFVIIVRRPKEMGVSTNIPIANYGKNRNDFSPFFAYVRVSFWLLFLNAEKVTARPARGQGDRSRKL